MGRPNPYNRTSLENWDRSSSFGHQWQRNYQQKNLLRLKVDLKRFDFVARSFENISADDESNHWNELMLRFSLSSSAALGSSLFSSPSRFELVRGELGPPGLEVVPQSVAGFADRRVVLVEHLAVGEDQADVVDELVAGFVHRRNGVELLLDGGQVHWSLDDLLVGRELLRVDRVEEGPSVIHGLHLGDDRRTDGQVPVGLGQLASLLRRRRGRSRSRRRCRCWRRRCYRRDAASSRSRRRHVHRLWRRRWCRRRLIFRPVGGVLVVRGRAVVGRRVFRVRRLKKVSR